MFADPIIIDATDDYAVIHKPAGMLSVPGKGEHKQDCATARVRRMFPNASGPLVVHRLDMDTSGLLVFGLTPESQRNLSRQFEDRTVTKSYIAVADGQVHQSQGVVNLPMRPDYSNRPWQMIDYIHGRHATTWYRVLGRGPLRTLLRLEPITGRAHQLRLHAAISAAQGGLGTPLVGDVLYHTAYSSLIDVQTDRSGPLTQKHSVMLERLMLHAAELTFDDPRTGRRVECTCPEPEVMQAVLGG